MQGVGGHSEAGTPRLAPHLPAQVEGSGSRGRMRGQPHAGIHMYIYALLELGMVEGEKTLFLYDAVLCCGW